MSSAVLSRFDSGFDFNVEELRQIQFRTVNPSRFNILGRNLQKAADLIKRNWKSFSPEEKMALQKFAYALLEPPTGVGSLKLKIQAAIYKLLIKATGQEKDFCFCLEAIDCFIDNILDAVERDDSSYQQVLSDTLKEVTDNPESGEPVDANTRLEWLRQLSDKAISKV
jgi:hypothetical protein